MPWESQQYLRNLPPKPVLKRTVGITTRLECLLKYSCFVLIHIWLRLLFLNDSLVSLVPLLSNVRVVCFAGIIASVECNGLSIQNNTVFNGKQAGIFLHRSSNDAIVKGT